MAGVNGQTITITIDGNAVATQRDVTVDDTTAFIATSSKDARHQDGIGGRTAGTVTLDALFIYNDAGQVALKTAQRAGTEVTLVWVDAGAGGGGHGRGVLVAHRASRSRALYSDLSGSGSRV